MVESKSGYFANDFNAYSEKLPNFISLSLNRLGADSECLSLKCLSLIPKPPADRRSEQVNLKGGWRLRNPPVSAETLEWNNNSSSELRVKNREDLMDRIVRCPKCEKRMVPVVIISGRTDFQCISCDDPAVRWAESSLTAPEKPIVAEPV